MDQKFKKNVQIITVAAVVVIFILALVAITLIVQKVQLDSIKAELQAQEAALDRKIENLNDEMDYRQTVEYIEKYAREKLGLIKAHETLWQRK